MPRASKSREVSFDHEVDFLVVGSGAGGLTAALAAAANGLNTLVIEKADVYGGTTALSGGNHLGAQQSNSHPRRALGQP